MKRFVFSFLICLLTLFALWLVANRSHILAFRSELPAYYAQTLCHCIHLQKLDKAYCQTQLAWPNFFNMSRWQENNERDTLKSKITVHFLGKSASAVFINTRQGCRLE